MVKMYVFSNYKSGELINEMRYIPISLKRTTLQNQKFVRSQVRLSKLLSELLA